MKVKNRPYGAEAPVCGEISIFPADTPTPTIQEEAQVTFDSGSGEVFSPPPYWLQRLKDAGIPSHLIKDLNGITARDPTMDSSGTRISKPLFDQDSEKEDNMKILYPDLYGSFYFYDNGNKNHSAKLFHRIRYKEPRPYIDLKTGEQKTNKYWQPKGSGQRPFFTPGVIEKYRKRETIKDLYVVEGEVKAFAGYAHGLDIIGIPSIHGFYGGEQKGKLHEDILELLIACRVENVILLYDADALTIRWERDKDLSKRPNLFLSSIKTFRENLQALLEGENPLLKNLFFMHGKSKYCEEGAKGLDDLLGKFSEKKDEIFADLAEKQFANKYFEGVIITASNFYSSLSKHFGMGGDVEVFYDLYKPYIQNSEFIWNKRRFGFDGEKVVYLCHEDTQRFMRIGPDWLKTIKVPNKHGDLEEEIVPWRIGEINRDYGKKYPDFLDKVPKYDSFCAVPCWNENYKRVHNDCFNLYAPLTHKPKKGKFETTEKLLKHLFQGVGDFNNDITGDPFTVALDYLTIQFKYPTQMLPVPCLVSPEYRTGKTTFLKWLRQIYGTNACVLGNEQFRMNFNAHYISKFIIGIDEGFLDIDKKAEKERLKQLVSADIVYMELKGINVKPIPYYGKLIICSNDADKIMKMEAGEDRWFVVRVPQITGDVDPDMEEKLKAEIPAWLHYLENRKIHHPKADRFWFKKEWFITDQFRKIVEVTKNRLDFSIEEYIREKFLTFKVQTLRIPLTYLVKAINEESKYKHDQREVKYYLQEKRGLKPQGVQRVKIPIGFIMGSSSFDPSIEPLIEEWETNCRPYVFEISEWLTPEELKETGHGVA